MLATQVRFQTRHADSERDSYHVERTAKGWELAGVPQRVLDEFSKRTEQVEQKAKELGITSAKQKDGLAALTRERKQKQFSKAELRELWDKRISADERQAIQNVRNVVASTSKISDRRAPDAS
jgi:conjugative relaxase-like TrwC/TraI family protein